MKKTKFSIASVMLCGALLGTSGAQAQWLKNGDFEGSGGWNMTWGGVLDSDAHTGEHSMKVHLDAPKWAGADQFVKIPDGADEVYVAGWMKTLKVESGFEEYEVARISVEFADVNKQQVGGYPDAVASEEWTTKWALYENTYEPPSNAAYVKIVAALGNCTGTVWYDDLEVKFFNGGDEIEAPKPKDYSKDGSNSLTNGNMEDPSNAEGWNLWGGEFVATAKEGTGGMKVTNVNPTWAGADQIINLPEGAVKIYVSGWMKTDGVVQGAESYEKARIALEFLDDNKSIVGGYPAPLAEAAGTNDWAHFSSTYDIHNGATAVKVQTVLGNCVGTAYYDDVQLKIIDEMGNILEKGQAPPGPRDQGKWYTLQTDAAKNGRNWVDWSNLLDAPAGKHGYLKSKDGDFVFEDGTPVKFWGVNVVEKHCFLSKAQADSMANRIAQMGANVVRLHHMDAPWSVPNIFGNTEETTGTRKLDPESMDKLDYLIAKLEEKGVYIFMDLLVHRKMTANDGTAETPQNGAKQIGMFDERVIFLQKEYAKNIFKHKNKYTGKIYAEDPGIIGTAFINESSIITTFVGDELTEHYRNVLVKQWEASPQYNGKTLSRFDYDYSNEAIKARAGFEDNVQASLEFYMATEKKFFDEMAAYLKDTLKCKFPTTGTNFPLQVLATQYNSLEHDYTATNTYFDHPQTWKINDDWSRVEYAPLENKSMIREMTLANVNNALKGRWTDRPLMVTEHQHCYPNEYQLEGIPHTVAYMSLQGIEGMIQFDYEEDAVGAERMTAFKTNRSAEHMANWVMAAPIVHRGYIKEAPGMIVDEIETADLTSLPNRSNFTKENPHFTFITKVQKAMEDWEKSGASPALYEKYYNQNSGVITSETGELKLNTSKGYMEINSPYVQGVTGNVGLQKWELPFMTIDLKNNWASVMIVSKDGKPLAEATGFYLVVTTPTKLEGQKYNASRQGLEILGEPPVLAQAAEGSVTLKTNDKITITPKTVYGDNMDALKATKADGGILIDLTQGQSFVYEISFK